MKTSRVGNWLLFGYVRPFRPELKTRELDAYEAVYCGLCKELGKSYGQLARFTLSYDFAFLGMISLGLRSQEPVYAKERCMAHPLKKRHCLANKSDLSYVAACAMVLFYYKLVDNIADGGRIKRIGYRFLFLFARRFRKKAIRRYPELDTIMLETIALQQQTEQDPNCTLDMAAEHSARALGRICEQMGETPTQRAVLERFGFLIGRWVYLMDALDDLKEDKEKGQFNPLQKWAQREHVTDENVIRSYAEGQINLTVGEIGLTYELLELQSYSSIIDNVIYIGLGAVKRQIVIGKQEETE